MTLTYINSTVVPPLTIGGAIASAEIQFEYRTESNYVVSISFRDSCKTELSTNRFEFIPLLSTPS